MPLTFAPDDSAAIPVYIVDSDHMDRWRDTAPSAVSAWADSVGFDAALGKVELMRGADGALLAVLGGFGTAQGRRRGRFHTAAIAAALPHGTYRLDSELAGAELEEAALGWLMTGYSFSRYKLQKRGLAQLVAPKGVDARRLEVIAAGESLTRDLVNTPANDLGPDELEAAIRALAREFGADVHTIMADDLLSQNFPLIHAVGRAAPRAPRLVEMRWGDTGPLLTLVGKGVCFDTGGLNLKPGGSMGTMKKDMGGAANVLGLAQMIMSLGLKLRLRVLIPAVENSVAGDAFRPGDILDSRKGLTVEVNNTDAEGRLVLADALALACEEKPDLLVSMATLTGAARVALGPDIAPFYATDDALAQTLETAADAVADPLWRMPFWDPYEAMLEPGIADLDNAPSGGFAGSITAALFLRRFVDQSVPYAHFDIFSWRPAAKPGLPKGGLGQGLRAILAALPEALKV